MMHSGIQDIPVGWAICDGKTYTYNGISSTTPNLKDKFIKAVTNKKDIKEDEEVVTEGLASSEVTFEYYALLFIMKL